MSIQNPYRFRSSNTTPPPRRRAREWFVALLGLWLFVSPWVLAFGGAGNTMAVEISHASWNAWVLGAIVFFVALGEATSLTPLRYQTRWFNLVLGAWIFCSPWALQLFDLPRAIWDMWVVGAIVLLAALAKYWLHGEAAGIEPVDAGAASPVRGGATAAFGEPTLTPPIVHDPLMADTAPAQRPPVPDDAPTAGAARPTQPPRPASPRQEPLPPAAGNINRPPRRSGSGRR